MCKRMMFLLLLLSSLVVIAQKEKINNQTANNQFDIDVELIGLDFSYKRRVSEKVMLGLSVGGVYKIKVGIQEQPGGFSSLGVGEVYSFSVFADFITKKHFHLILGVKAGYLTNIDADMGGFYGIEMGFFHSFRVLEIGIKPILGIFNEKSSAAVLLGTSLLVIRMPIVRWK